MRMQRKKELIEEIGMKFDEAMELFNEETLESMSMVNIVGGTNTYCSGAQCVSGCQNQCGGCGTGSGGTTGSGTGNGTGVGTGSGTTLFAVYACAQICGK